MTLTAIVIILVLIALNGLFVAAEFTIVGAPKASIDRLARQGSRAARAVRRILEDPIKQDRFIATAQLGITAASLGLGMYGEHLLAEWLAGHFGRLGVGRFIAAHTVASITAILVLTYFHIVLGEMIPKSLALQRAQRMSLWIVPVMRVVQLALYPLVIVLNGIGNASLRVMGIRRERSGTEHYMSSEELAYLVRETEAGGLLRKESAGVVQELFKFGELSAGDVMVPRIKVVGLPAGAGREEIREVLTSAPHTRYPVFDGTIDAIIGVAHVKDLLRCLAADGHLTKGYIRATPLLPASATTGRVLTAMGEARSQLAVVIDEHGGTEGIVTIEDLFEEVVGDFGDDSGASAARAEGSPLTVPGSMRLSEAGRELGVILDHDKVETVSGLVLETLGRGAHVGDVVEYAAVRIEVTALERRGVAKAVISLRDNS